MAVATEDGPQLAKEVGTVAEGESGVRMGVEVGSGDA